MAADVVNIAKSTPTLRRIAQPVRRDRFAVSTHLGGMTPERLANIMRDAERGRLEDWADLCELMLETDSHLSAVYDTRIESVVGAPWDVVPGSRANDVVEPIDEQAADFCKSMLEGVPNIEEAFGNILNGLGGGVSVNELEWSRRNSTWVVSNILWRHARRFAFDEAWALRLYDGGEHNEHGPYGMPLEAHKFIIFLSTARGSYPTRSGIFRKTGWAWLFKRWILKFAVTAAERLGTPLALGTVPVNADAAVQDALLDILENLTARQAGVVTEGTSIDFLDTKIREGSSTFLDLLGFLNSEISKAVLGNTLTTEVQDVGARAAADSQFDSAQLPRIKADARRLAGIIEEQLFTPALKFNLHLFGGQMPIVPKLAFMVEPEPEPPQLQEFMLRGRVVRRNEVREWMNLPELTEAEGGNELLDLTPGMPGAGGFTTGPLVSAPGGEPPEVPLPTSPSNGSRPAVVNASNRPGIPESSQTSPSWTDPLRTALFGL
jgi:phage gp29-like protein